MFLYSLTNEAFLFPWHLEAEQLSVAYWDHRMHVIQRVSAILFALAWITAALHYTALLYKIRKIRLEHQYTTRVIGQSK